MKYLIHLAWINYVLIAVALISYLINGSILRIYKDDIHNYLTILPVVLSGLLSIIMSFQKHPWITSHFTRIRNLFLMTGIIVIFGIVSIFFAPFIFALVFILYLYHLIKGIIFLYKNHPII